MLDNSTIETLKAMHCSAMASELENQLNDSKTYGTLAFEERCQTAHCGRHKPHFDFGELAFPIVPYRHLPQTLRGLTAECRSLV